MVASYPMPDRIGVFMIAFTQGFLIAVLNPQDGAVLPRLPSPVRKPEPWFDQVQLAILGLILVAIGFCSDTVYALLSGTFGNWLMRRRGFARGRRYDVGGTYIMLGAIAAVTRPVRTG